MAPIAAALFFILWTSIFDGFEAMLNLYVAIGAVASAAYFLRSAISRSARSASCGSPSGSPSPR